MSATSMKYPHLHSSSEHDHPLVHRLVATSGAWAPTVARLTLGLVMLPHALQKTVGLFGGHGFGGTYAAFTGMGMPGVVVVLVIVGEILGSIALIAGALTRVGAAAIAAIMAGAIAMVHAKEGFFMNWYGQKQGEGFEYHLLALGLAAVCLAMGGGKLSVDRKLAEAV